MKKRNAVLSPLSFQNLLLQLDTCALELIGKMKNTPFSTDPSEFENGVDPFAWVPVTLPTRFPSGVDAVSKEYSTLLVTYEAKFLRWAEARR
jgi:hypothetical protein